MRSALIFATATLATCAIAAPAAAAGPPPGGSVWLARGDGSGVSGSYYVRSGSSLRMVWVSGQEWGCTWGTVDGDRARMRGDRGEKFVMDFDRRGTVMFTRSKSPGSQWSTWLRSKRTTAPKANRALNAPFNTNVRIKKLYRQCTWEQPTT